MQCYMPSTGIVRITYTLQFITEAFTFPKTTTDDYPQQEIGEIFEMIKYPLNTLPLIYYGDATKKCNQSDFPHLANNHIPALIPIFSSPLMLPQSQNENIQHQNIISTPAPAPSVEPFYHTAS